MSSDGLLTAVHGHWQVENGLHSIKDRWWDEDRHYSKRPRLAEGFAVLLNAVVTVLEATADPADNLPVRARATPWVGTSNTPSNSWPVRSCDFAILLCGLAPTTAQEIVWTTIVQKAIVPS